MTNDIKTIVDVWLAPLKNPQDYTIQLADTRAALVYGPMQDMWAAGIRLNRSYELRAFRDQEGPNSHIWVVTHKRAIIEGAVHPLDPGEEVDPNLYPVNANVASILDEHVERYKRIIGEYQYSGLRNGFFWIHRVMMDTDYIANIMVKRGEDKELAYDRNTRVVLSYSGKYEDLPNPWWDLRGVFLEIDGELEELPMDITKLTRMNELDSDTATDLVEFFQGVIFKAYFDYPEDLTLLVHAVDTQRRAHNLATTISRGQASKNPEFKRVAQDLIKLDFRIRASKFMGQEGQSILPDDMADKFSETKDAERLREELTGEGGMVNVTIPIDLPDD